MTADHTRLTPRRFVSFSSSMFAIGLISVGWGALDLAMLAPFGEDNVAAMGMGEAVTMTISAFLAGLIDAFSGRVAQAEGAGETGRRLPLLFCAFLVVLLPVAVVLLLGALLVSPFLELIGQNPELVPLASDFVAIRLIGAVPVLVVSAFLEMLKICGLQTAVIRLLTLGLGLDALLNWCVLWGPAEGWFDSPLTAVAVTTVLAQFTMGALAGVVVVRAFRRRGDVFVRPAARDVRTEAVSIGRVGSGIGVHQFNDYAGATVPLLMIGTLSVPTVAAATVATKLWTLYCRVPQACFTTGFVFYGYAVGRDQAEARELVTRLRTYAALPTVVGAVLMMAASPLLVRAFGGPDADIGQGVLLLAAYFLSLGGYFYSALYGELLGVRQEGSFLSSRSTVVTYALALPLAAIGVFVFDSAFLALASGTIPAVVLSVLFVGRMRELSEVPVEQAPA